MKLGYIDYLNCYPFYYDMLEKRPINGVQVVAGYPSELNRMMKTNELDMSPISSGAYPDLQDELILLPDFCLSSVGYVKSVMLISKVPIEHLEGCRVGLSSASQTSVILLKILLSKYYNIDPVYVPASPMPSLDEIDAALIIGNEAIMETENIIPYTYDLGDLWMRKTGNAVVFAVFAVRESVLNRYAVEIKMIIKSYRKSLRNLQTDRKDLIKKAGKRYKKINFDIDSYYDLLKFDFTDELKSALEFYFSEAGKMGFLKNVKSLRFIPGDLTDCG